MCVCVCLDGGDSDESEPSLEKSGQTTDVAENQTTTAYVWACTDAGGSNACRVMACFVPTQSQTHQGHPD